MMIKTWMVVPLAGALVVLGCGRQQNIKAEHSSSSSGAAYAHDDDEDDDGEDENEETIDLAQVPDSIKKAAQDAVPGLVLKSAEKETEHGVLVYSLEGTAGGEAVEVEVNASGKVLEIEHGEEDEEDD